MQPFRIINFPDKQLAATMLLCLCGLMLMPRAANSDSNTISFITDIAPIHSLVSMVVGQQAEVQILIPPGQSPHSFNLKPSQIRTINQASVIVTLGDNFTPTLSRHLKSIDKQAVVLQLSDTRSQNQHIEAGNLRQVAKKTNDNDHSTGHGTEQNLPVLTEQTNTSDTHMDDPHTWLNPENAIRWLDRIATTAMELDKSNRTIYQNNLDVAKANLLAMHEDFTRQLAKVRSTPYIVYHDAYQHFAHSYGLQKPVAIALSDARAPGAKKLRAMRAQAKQTRCVFSELQHDDRMVDTVTAGLPVKRAQLDPLGSTIPLGPDHYPQMMRDLVINFVACLS